MFIEQPDDLSGDLYQLPNLASYEEKTENDPEKQSEVEHSWPQILAILTGALAAFTEGALFAWTSPCIIKITNDKKRYDISENEATGITAIQPLTLIFSCWMMSKLCDIIGRKKMLLLISLPQILSLIISAFARQIYTFYAARFFSGLSNAIMWTAMPMYIGEIASPKVRGLWGNALSSAIYLGQFFINIVGSYCDIPTTSYIFLPFPIIFFFIFLFMPETPYYYVIKGDYDAARKSIEFLTRKKNVQADYLKLKKDLERQMSEPGTWRDLFFIRSNRTALIAGVFLRSSQQLGGMSVLNQYTQFIFKQAGGFVNPEISSIIFSGIGTFLNVIVVIFIVDKFSRKNLYTLSLGLSSFVLLIMTVYFILNKVLLPKNLIYINWLPLTLLISYQVVSAFGVDVIPGLMLGELFSASVKAKALSIVTVILAVTIFLANGIFSTLDSIFGAYAPFMVFTMVAAVSTVLSWYLVPETKGKTLEEIQIILKTEKLYAKR